MNDESAETIEQILEALETAQANNDIEGMLSLFAPDVTIESPLVSRVMNRNEGICRGREELRLLVRALMEKGVPWGEHAPPLIRGNTAAIEYMRASSDEPFSVDIIEVEDGKIQSLRAYVGWRALAQ